MATLVLTAVGSVFGPIGAAIGALAGQAIDGAIFRPAGRQGPRIADLRVQTSSFGTQVPAIFGAMRVAGTVIWATDLIETSQTSGGGKGQPSVTTFSYSASFAVALSSRPIVRIGRIWADGNLLRGNAGDFKSGIGAFRVHDGSADQPADPLITAQRGSATTPAHRGMAYAVFEGLSLADFGNRIPSLTFELFADEGEVGVGQIAGALVGEDVAVAGDGGLALGGYAASGNDVGEALGPVIGGYDLLMRAGAAGLAVTTGVAVDALLSPEDDLRFSGGRALAGREVERAAVEDVPRRLSVRHYDPARDYQAGVQAAERQGAGWVETDIDLPATLGTANAKARAGDLLRRRMLGRRGVSLARGWAALALAPGDVVAFADSAGGWRIASIEWEAMAVRIGLTAVPERSLAVPGAVDAGSGVAQPDVPVGATHLALFETPQLFDALAERPQMFVAACGESRAWRGAAVLLRDEDGGYSPLGTVRRPAVLGKTVSILPSGPASLFDRRSMVEIDLFDADAVLAGASDAALLAGANACMIGEELLQFGSAVPITPGRWRLSGLLRGRRGSEAFVGAHGVGERFVLLDEAGLLPVTDRRVVAGRSLAVAATGVGDVVPAEAAGDVDGRAMLPLSPVHLRVEGSAAAGVSARWVRRSRLGWEWADGADAPLVEEREVWHVEILAGDRPIRIEDRPSPFWSASPETIAADLAVAGGDPLTLRVRQRGTHGLGRPASAPVPV